MNCWILFRTLSAQELSTNKDISPGKSAISLVLRAVKAS